MNNLDWRMHNATQAFFIAILTTIRIYAFNRADMEVRQPREALCDHFEQILVHSRQVRHSEAKKIRYNIFFRGNSSKIPGQQKLRQETAVRAINIKTSQVRKVLEDISVLRDEESRHRQSPKCMRLDQQKYDI